MTPSQVIYPRSVEDIKVYVNQAAEQGIGIAIRTGGHQFSGASSSAGRNIQIDLSNTFKDPTENFVYNNDTQKGTGRQYNLLKVGVSYSLLEFNTLLSKQNMYLPGKFL